jgi:hypothetical protein
MTEETRPEWKATFAFPRCSGRDATERIPAAIQAGEIVVAYDGAAEGTREFLRTMGGPRADKVLLRDPV